MKKFHPERWLFDFFMIVNMSKIVCKKLWISPFSQKILDFLSRGDANVTHLMCSTGPFNPLLKWNIQKATLIHWEEESLLIFLREEVHIFSYRTNHTRVLPRYALHFCHAMEQLYLISVNIIRFQGKIRRICHLKLSKMSKFHLGNGIYIPPFKTEKK